MVGIGDIRAAIEAAISGLQADGRYCLSLDGTPETWTVSPDSSEGEMALRDLMATLKIGGFRTSGKVYLYPVAVQVLVSNYTDTRSRSGSLSPITARDRLDGAARHIADTLSALSLPGSLLHADECSETVLSPDRDWLFATILLTLTTPR